MTRKKVVREEKSPTNLIKVISFQQFSINLEFRTKICTFEEDVQTENCWNFHIGFKAISSLIVEVECAICLFIECISA